MGWDTTLALILFILTPASSDPGEKAAPPHKQDDNRPMNIDESGNMELTAEENQNLMDQLEINPEEYDDPPVEIECTGMEEGAATFKASNTKTGKTVVMVFDFLPEPN